MRNRKTQTAADMVRADFDGGKTGRIKWIFASAGAVFVLAAYLSLTLGSVVLSPFQLIQAASGGGSRVVSSIFWYVRLPRTVGSILAGAALAVSGAVLQNILSNSLASPGIIGVNSGAGLGVALASTIGFTSGWCASFGAFAGSMIAAGAVALIAKKSGGSKSTVILCGAALGSVFGAFSEALGVLDDNTALTSADFRVGGFSSVSYGRLVPAAVMIIVSLTVLFTLFSELDALSLGDELSRGIGLRSGMWRVVFLVIAACLASSAVSYAGLLGFVGLIVPHFVRKIAGSGSRRLIPLCLLFGGAFVCLCDTAARTLFLPHELPVGIIMSVVGGPLFVVLLVKYKGDAYDG